MKNLLLAALASLTLTASAQAGTVMDMAEKDERFSALVSAVNAADLAETLRGPGPFTIFAPTDAAFSSLGAGMVETLLEPVNKGRLTDILLYHVDNRTLTTAIFPAGSNLFKPVLETHRICVTKDGKELSITDGSGQAAQVIVADIKASNGVIHVIDKVLVPGPRPDCT